MQFAPTHTYASVTNPDAVAPARRYVFRRGGAGDAKYFAEEEAGGAQSGALPEFAWAGAGPLPLVFHVEADNVGNVQKRLDMDFSDSDTHNKG